MKLRYILPILLLCALAHGQTINLPAGVQTIAPQSGKIYVGAPLDANGNPTTFIRSTSTAPSTWAVNISNLHDIQFQRIEFGGNGTANAGGGIKGSNSYNIGITDCAITHCLRPDNSADPQGFCFTDVHDITLKNLRFEDDAWAVIFAGKSYNVTGDQIIFKNCGHMLKGMWNPGSHNVHFTHIGFEDSKWGNYGSEFQPLIKNPTGLDDFSITDFYYIRPHMGTSTDSTGVISWPLEGAPGGTTNVHIARGYVDGTTSDGRKPPQFISLAMVLETSGNGNGDPVNPSCVAENMWIRNCNDPDAMNLSATKFVVRNNLTENVLGQFDMQGGPNTGGNVFTNNGPNVQLPAVGGWSMLGISPPGIAAPPVTQSSPPATVPINTFALAIKPTSDTSAQVSLSNLPLVAHDVTIIATSSTIQEPVLQITIPSANFPATIYPLRAGWLLDYVAVALDASNKEIARTAVITKVQQTGDGGAAYPPTTQSNNDSAIAALQSQLAAETAKENADQAVIAALQAKIAAAQKDLEN